MTTNQPAHSAKESNMDSIVINGVEYVPKAQTLDMSNCSIIRCQKAGVHFGRVLERDGVRVLVADSRRLWRWWSKATLSELAMEGPLAGKEQKYGCVLPRLEIMTADVGEIIPCTKAAAAAIYAVPVWTAAS